MALKKSLGQTYCSECSEKWDSIRQELLSQPDSIKARRSFASLQAVAAGQLTAWKESKEGLMLKKEDLSHEEYSKREKEISDGIDGFKNLLNAMTEFAKEKGIELKQSFSQAVKSAQAKPKRADEAEPAESSPEALSAEGSISVRSLGKGVFKRASSEESGGCTKCEIK